MMMIMIYNLQNNVPIYTFIYWLRYNSECTDECSVWFWRRQTAWDRGLPTSQPSRWWRTQFQAPSWKSSCAYQVVLTLSLYLAVFPLHCHNHNNTFCLFRPSKGRNPHRRTSCKLVGNPGCELVSNSFSTSSPSGLQL